MSVDEKSTYYDAGGIEVIEIIKAKLTDEQFEGFCLGNAIKYNCRYNFKHDNMESKMRDIEKSLKYLELLKEAEKEKMHCFSLNFENKKIYMKECTHPNFNNWFLCENARCRPADLWQPGVHPCKFLHCEITGQVFCTFDNQERTKTGQEQPFNVWGICMYRLTH